MSRVVALRSRVGILVVTLLALAPVGAAAQAIIQPTPGREQRPESMGNLLEKAN